MKELSSLFRIGIQNWRQALLAGVMVSATAIAPPTFAQGKVLRIA